MTKRFPKLEERDILRVRWQDAGSQGGWFDAANDREMREREEELVVTEVGHFVRWREKGLWMCEGFIQHRDGSYGSVAGSFIPKGCILTIEVLKRAKNRSNRG